jgi:iron(III) transport system substrate-binding protein
MTCLHRAALAAGEKKVVVAVYAADVPFFSNTIKPIFEERFPGIQVDIRGFDVFQMGVQVLSELNARIDTVDVFMNSLVLTKPLIDAGYIDRDIDWKGLGVSPARVGRDNLLYNNDGICGAVTYNTNLIRPDDLPPSIEGFTDPKFRGKMSVGPNDFAACLGFRVLLTRDFDGVLQLGRDLKTNDILFTPNSEQLMLSGERPLHVMASPSRVAQLQSEGAPLAIKLYPGTGMWRTRWSIIKTTKEPNAAKLWALFATSKEFMEKWDDDRKGGVGTSDEDLTGRGMPAWLRRSGYDAADPSLFLKEDWENFAQRAEASSKLLEALR